VRPVAYLSAEFGIHESLPIYSGGLGVLAGDHLKTASDLGLALVAVGLFYRESYFRQHIDRQGQQHAQYEKVAIDYLPATPLRAAGTHWGGLHLNEGHSAFATLEYARLHMEATGADFWTAAQEVAQSTVFTTHTPVDAGHDRFPPELVDEHLDPLRRSLDLTR